MDLAFISRSRSCLRETVICLLVSIQLALFQIADCAAGVGLAEWTIETPERTGLQIQTCWPIRASVCIGRPRLVAYWMTRLYAFLTFNGGCTLEVMLSARQRRGASFSTSDRERCGTLTAKRTSKLE